MDKKLALAFEFKNAPEELKKAAEVHRENWITLEKAEAQVQKWTAARELAIRAYSESDKAFQRAIEAWDVGGKKKPDLEEKK